MKLTYTVTGAHCCYVFLRGSDDDSSMLPSDDPAVPSWSGGQTSNGKRIVVQCPVGRERAAMTDSRTEIN